MAEATETSAINLVGRCFTKEQFEFLESKPLFVQAVRNIQSTQEAIDVIDMGEQLLKHRQ